MYRKDGTPVGYTKIAALEEFLGHPWWIVHRAHFHGGLGNMVEDLEYENYIDSAVAKINHESISSISMETTEGKKNSLNC